MDALEALIGRRLVMVAAGCAAALSLAGCQRAAAPAPAPAFHGVDITGADYARRLALPDADGRMRSLDDWKGKVVVVFFGYAQCPDVCPATLSQLAEVRRQLGPDGARLQVVLVTVDPERDTPEVLREYVANFDAGIVALRGSESQLREVAREFKVYYGKVPGKTADRYTVDHSAGSYVFDKTGRVRLFVRLETPPPDWLADLKTLMSQG